MIYVLVHGSWHGAWCWQKVIPLLTRAGHQVLAPDLPAHGQDKTPYVNVTLGDYVDCIGALLAKCDEPVILVGHSMAGMVISQVAEQFPEKIKKLVYLAAFLPQSGESLLSIAKLQKPTKLTQAMRIDSAENAIYFPSESMYQFAYQRSVASEYAAIASQLCIEPFQPWLDAVTLTAKRYGIVPRVYVVCEDDNAIHLASQQRMLQQTPCKVFQLDCDHSPFYSDPQALVEILMQSS